MNSKCLFCFSEKSSPSYLPSTFFNNKRFDCLTCSNCGLHYINPLPDDSDFMAMYPPSYQSGVNREICKDQYKKISGLRFSYGKQFDLINKHFKNARVLDYGCGHGNFLINAKHMGFECDGTEFNPTHVELLRKEIPGSNFYTIPNFLNDKNLKYDVIRLSNVLEHLTNPVEITKQLIDKLTPGGLLLIEGPIETNANLGFWIRKIYFKQRKNEPANHPPTHIFFSDSKNQRAFFENLGMKELHFQLSESAWPFPDKFSDVKGPGALFKYLAGKLSVGLKPLNKNWGNTFIYLGTPSAAKRES